MRLVLMGTPDFAVPTLEQVAHSRHELVGVVTRPDAPRGRGRMSASPEVKTAARDFGAPILQPSSLTDPVFLNDLNVLQADLFVVVAFLVLPPKVLGIPRLGSVNLHPSLLPKYRGAAPIHWAVIRGEQTTGVTVFRLSRQVDAGDLLIQEPVDIGRDETVGELYERLKFLGADLMVRAIDGLADGTLKPISQSPSGVTRAPKLTKADGLIKWSSDAESIRNLVRGTNPFPGAFTLWREKPLKIHRTEHASGKGHPGCVIEADPRAGISVATGTGVLRLLSVQPAGKRAIGGVDFVRGYDIRAGERLG